MRHDTMRYPTRGTARGLEYWLMRGDEKLCPHPSFVGGASQHICSCDDPTKCPGVVNTIARIKAEGWKIE